MLRIDPATDTVTMLGAVGPDAEAAEADAEAAIAEANAYVRESSQEIRGKKTEEEEEKDWKVRRIQRATEEASQKRQQGGG